MEAEAYVNASRGILTAQDVARLKESASMRLDALLEVDRYYGGSLVEALASSYQVERHLYRAYTWLNQCQASFASGRPVEVMVADSYSALDTALMHMRIAEYLLRGAGGKSFHAEVSMLNQRLLDSLAGRLQAVDRGSVTPLGEAARFLDRAIEMRDMGLYSYSTIDALHAYILLKSAYGSNLKDPGDDSWSVSARDLYNAKLQAVEALAGVDTSNRIAAILAYRLYGYVSGVDDAIVRGLELGALRQGEGSGLLKYIYLELREGRPGCGVHRGGAEPPGR